MQCQDCLRGSEGFVARAPKTAQKVVWPINIHFNRFSFSRRCPSSAVTQLACPPPVRRLELTAHPHEWSEPACPSLVYSTCPTQPVALLDLAGATVRTVSRPYPRQPRSSKSGRVCKGCPQCCMPRVIVDPAVHAAQCRDRRGTGQHGRTDTVYCARWQRAAPRTPGRVK